MTAFNVVRFKVKPGLAGDFVEVHRRMRPDFKGFVGGHLVKTGDDTFCFVGEWRAYRNIAAARPQMIALLDEVRDLLQDLGGELGVTDPVSGESVVALRVPAAAKKAAKKATAKTTGNQVGAKSAAGRGKTAGRAQKR